MLNFILLGINIFLPIIKTDFSYNINFLISYNGIGLEYRFHPHLKVGGLLQYPEESNFYNDIKSTILFSTQNYNYNIVGYRQIEDTKFYQADTFLYVNLYPWKEYGFYVNLFYHYFSGFSKEISSIPLSDNRNLKYIEMQNYSFSNFIPFISYKLYNKPSNHGGFAIGYEYWLNKRMFINLMYGYYVDSLKDSPDKIIYFSDKTKWFFYKDQQYRIEDFILQERELMNINNNNRFRFYLYFIIGVKIR
ncbi:MAG: hypothetical protein KatS3mg129_2484 [Leptospiraceae bacterium]|nr:MAG: hypothetical protein KatS3mg129_2484 [Leptospiraceae bacterium]